MTEQHRLIARDPDFVALLRRRQRVRFALTGLLVTLYLGFALISLYAPHWFSTPLAAGSVVGFGLLAAYAIIGLSIVLAGGYVYWANTRFQALENQVRAALKEALEP